MKNWVKHSVVILTGVIGVFAIYSGWSTHYPPSDSSMLAKARSGDRMDWKEPNFDDSDWLNYVEWQRQEGPYQGNLWLRQTLQLGDNPKINTFVLVAVGSSEIWFDGELIGQNGLVGVDQQTEEAGSILFACSIPSHLLTPGEHQVALRISNHRGIGRFYMLGAGVGSIDDVLSFTRRSMFPFFFLSVFLVVAVYFLVLYLGNRKEHSLLVFASICAVTGLLLFIESIRAIGYPYHWHGYRLYMVSVVSGILGGLISLFFILRHHFTGSWIWGVPAALIVGLLFFPRSLDHVAFGMFLCSFLYAQVVVGVAWLREKSDAWISVLAVGQVLTVLAMTRMDFMERGLFACLTLMIVLILLSLGFQLKRQRAQFQKAQLRSARLQIELLKKHLQPHFVLNTLTAVMEWLERDPKAGVAFIGLLAQEMKTMNRIAGQKLVSLDEELELCRNHLKILAYRSGEAHPFETRCDHPNLAIPPALILTLVENGVSYALDEETVGFEVRQYLGEDHNIHIIVRAIGVDIQSGEADDGTGGKYLKARLEESYPDRWVLEASGENQAWTTHIRIKDCL